MKPILEIPTTTTTKKSSESMQYSYIQVNSVCVYTCRSECKTKEQHTNINCIKLLIKFICLYNTPFIKLNLCLDMPNISTWANHCHAQKHTQCTHPLQKKQIERERGKIWIKGHRQQDKEGKHRVAMFTQSKGYSLAVGIFSSLTSFQE